MKKISYTRIFMLLLMLFGWALAGTTGKIAGRISDAKTGESLIGVNLQLEGTALGSSTDVDGYFVILNVPPGLYNLNISYIGYQTVVMKEVRVNVDFTTRIEQGMTPTTVEMGEVEVYGERNPLVRQDLTNTQVAVTSEQIEELPVDQISDVLALQAGIVQDNSGGLHIRGGRSNEIAFQVNGLSINNPFFNSQGVGLATNAVEEVSVSAGTFSAEYGNALSGVVNFVTKDGGSDLSGTLRAWTGDNVSGRDDVFWNIDEHDPLNNARMEWTLGGPVPLFGNKVTFFTSGVWQEDKGHLYGMRVYNTDDLLEFDGDRLRIDPFGIAYSRNPDGTIHRDSSFARAGANGDREIVPMVTRESWNITGKLTWKARHNIKFNYDLIRDNGESYSSGYFRTYRFTPDGRPKTYTDNTSHSFGITHTLSKNTFYTLKVGANYNNAKSYVYEDPFDPRYIPPPGGDIGNLIIPPTGTYYAGGTNLDRTVREARSYIGKLDVVSQVLPNHEIKFGGEFASHRLDLDSYTLLYSTAQNRFVIPSGADDSEFIGFQRYRQEPVQAAFYVLDKMELAKRFIFNAGLRYEYLNTKAQYNPDIAGSVDTGVRENLQDAEPKHRLAPRLSLSFPITSRGIIRFSYGFFFQAPTFSDVYTNSRFIDYNFLLTPTFGNPNLKPQRSIQYEMGLQQQFTDDLKIDLTVFYKDVNDLIEFRRVVAGEVAVDKEFNVLTNISYASVKGFTAALLKRRAPGSLFSATLDYTFQIGEGAFTDPLALAVDTRTGRQTEQKFIPLSFDRTHTLNATVTLSQPRNWVASAIGSIQSGTPYTPSVPSSIQPVEFETNSARRPLLTNVDIKLEKFLQLSKVRLSLFMQVENLFDIMQERFIHTNTGRSLTNLATTTNPNQFNNLEDTINRRPDDYFPVSFLENFYRREDFLGAPREVRMGLTFQF